MLALGPIFVRNFSYFLCLLAHPKQGSLSDRLGKKWFIVGGALLGVVGAVVSGSAHKMTTVIAGNILSGAGNAGCVGGWIDIR